MLEILNSSKREHQVQLSSPHVLFPVAIETAGTWDHQAVELIQIERRTVSITDDARETTGLFQQLSMALQGGMRSHYEARSQPANLLQAIILFI